MSSSTDCWRASRCCRSRPRSARSSIRPPRSASRASTEADADPRLPCQVVATGVNQVVACVGDPDTLARVVPDYEGIGALLGAHGAITLYVAAVDPETGRALARSFMGTAEMGEDPATGSAVGPLAAHVAARTGAERLEVVQGVEMGRPSLLRTAIEGDHVRVGGDAVILIEGIVHLDG